MLSTLPLPCPYLEGKMESRLLTQITGTENLNVFNRLSAKGFRRNSGFAYTTVCPDCDECLPIRIKAFEFKPSASLRKSLRRNRDITVTEMPPKADQKHYELFRRYLDARHKHSEMAAMDFFDYTQMIEDGAANTELREFRQGADNKLIGVALVDVLEDGISAVYSFFDPERAKDSLGSVIVALLGQEAARKNLPFVYLGYFIKKCPNMAYKSRFKPYEIYQNGKWQEPSPL